jgi:AcrR family transcriptional regulator
MFIVSNMKIVFYICSMNDELKTILDKVSVLYRRYGIKSITMDDVSRELGISKKTLYQYVADKTDLVNKILELEMSSRSCEFENILGCDKNAIEELIDVHRFVYKKLKEINPSAEYDLRKYYPDLFHKFQEDRQQKMYANILSNLKKGKEQGLYRADLNEDIITKLIVMRSELSGGIDAYAIHEITSPEFFTEVMIYHIRGIANEKGIEVLEANMHKLRNPIKE